MNNRKGFTLVELLAVIAILAILVIIALPNVINMYNKAQKEIFLTEAKKVHSEAEKRFISNSISAKPTKVINSEDNTKLDMTGEKLQYCVILDNKGKVTSMKVSNGKWIASLDNGKTVDDLSIDDLEEGSLDGYKCSSKTVSTPEAIYCTFDGNMVQGAEYVNGQYTYRYKQEGKYASSGLAWQNITSDGWGVQLTDKASTDPVTSKLCSSISGKPIVSMSSMFSESEATTLDVSSFDTSNVTNMSYMFYNSQATTLDVSNFDTSKVTDMGNMFSNSKATTLDVSNFDTSNVTNMYGMFSGSKATTLDVSNFDTSNVTNMISMFYNSKATTLDVSNFDTSNVTSMNAMFNSSINLKTIYVSDKFKTGKVTSSNYMFSSCTALVGGAGTKYNSSHVDKAYAHIDGGTSNPGYFTKK